MDKKVIVESLEDQRSKHLQTIQKLLPVDNVRPKVKMISKEGARTFTHCTPPNDNTGNGPMKNQQNSYTHVHPYRLVSQRPIMLKHGYFSPSPTVPSQIQYSKTFYQNMYSSQQYSETNTHETAKGIYKNYEMISKENLSPNRLKMTNGEVGSGTIRDSQKQRSIKIFRKNLTALDEDSKKKVTSPLTVPNLLKQDILDKEFEVLESLDDQSLTLIVKKTMDICNKMYGDALAEELQNHLGVEAYAEIANRGMVTTYAEFLAKRHFELNKENCSEVAQTHRPDTRPEVFDDEEQKLFELTATRVQKNSVFIKVDPKMLKSSRMTTNGDQSRELERIQEKSGQKFILKGNCRIQSNVDRNKAESSFPANCEKNSLSLGNENTNINSPPNSANLFHNISSEISEFALKDDTKAIAEEVLTQEEKRAADLIISEKIAQFQSCAPLVDSLEDNFTFNDSQVNANPPEKIFDSPDDPITKTPKSLLRQEIIPRNILRVGEVERTQETAVVVAATEPEKRQELCCRDVTYSNHLDKQTLSHEKVSPLIHTVTSNESIVLSSSVSENQSDFSSVGKEVTLLASTDGEIHPGFSSSKTTLAIKSVEDELSRLNNLPEEEKPGKISPKNSNNLDEKTRSLENGKTPMQPATSTESAVSSNSVQENQSTGSKDGKTVTVLLSSDGKIQDVLPGFRSTNAKTSEENLSLSKKLLKDQKSLKENVELLKKDEPFENYSSNPKAKTLRKMAQELHMLMLSADSQSVSKNEAMEVMNSADSCQLNTDQNEARETTTPETSFKTNPNIVKIDHETDPETRANSENKNGSQDVQDTTNGKQFEDLQRRGVTIVKCLDHKISPNSNQTDLKVPECDSLTVERTNREQTSKVNPCTAENHKSKISIKNHVVNASALKQELKKQSEQPDIHRITDDEKLSDKEMFQINIDTSKEKYVESEKRKSQSPDLETSMNDLAQLLISLQETLPGSSRCSSSSGISNESFETFAQSTVRSFKIENGDCNLVKTESEVDSVINTADKQNISHESIREESDEKKLDVEHSVSEAETSVNDVAQLLVNFQKSSSIPFKTNCGENGKDVGSKPEHVNNDDNDCVLVEVKDTHGYEDALVAEKIAKNKTEPTEIVNHLETSAPKKKIKSDNRKNSLSIAASQDTLNGSGSPTTKVSKIDSSTGLPRHNDTNSTSHTSATLNCDHDYEVVENIVNNRSEPTEIVNLMETSPKKLISDTRKNSLSIATSQDPVNGLKYSTNKVSKTDSSIRSPRHKNTNSTSHITAKLYCDNDCEASLVVENIVRNKTEPTDVVNLLESCPPKKKLKSDNRKYSSDIATSHDIVNALKSPTTKVSKNGSSIRSPLRKDTNSTSLKTAKLCCDHDNAGRPVDNIVKNESEPIEIVNLLESSPHKKTSYNRRNSSSIAISQDLLNGLKSPSTKVSKIDRCTRSPRRKDTNSTSHTTPKLPKIKGSGMEVKATTRTRKDQSKSPMVTLGVTDVPATSIKKEPKDPDVTVEDEDCIFVDLIRPIVETPLSHNSGQHEEGFRYRRAEKLKQHRQRFFLSKKVKSLSTIIHRRIRTAEHTYKLFRKLVSIINSNRDCATLDTKTLQCKIKSLNTINRLIGRTPMISKKKDIRSLKGAYQKILLVEGGRKVFSNVRIVSRKMKLNRSIGTRRITACDGDNRDQNDYIVDGKDLVCVPQFEQQVVMKPLKTYSNAKRSSFRIKRETPYENMNTFDDVRKSSIDRNRENGDGMKYASTPESIVHCIIYKDSVPTARKIDKEIKLELDTEAQTSIEMPFSSEMVTIKQEMPRSPGMVTIKQEMPHSPEMATIKQESIDYSPEINKGTHPRRCHRNRKSNSKTPDKNAVLPAKKVHHLRSRTPVESTPPKKKRDLFRTPDIQRVYPLRNRRTGNSA